MRGGSRPGSGRPKGSTNQRTKAFETARDAAGLTSLAYLQSLYRDETVPRADRIDAASKCLPYEHAKVPAQINGSLHTVDLAALAKLTDDELARLEAVSARLHGDTDAGADQG